MVDGVPAESAKKMRDVSGCRYGVDADVAIARIAEVVQVTSAGDIS